MPVPWELRPRRVPRQARSRAMFEALVEATARVLVADGYPAVTTNRVADVAGVSVGSLYQYFPGKDALVHAVAQRHFDEMTQLLTQHTVMALGRSIEEVVRSYVAGLFAAHRLDPALHLAISQHVMALGLEHLDDLQNQARALVRSWLEAHRAQMRPGDLDHAAFLLVTTAEAAIHGAQLYNPALLHDPQFAEELVSMLLRYLLD